MVITVTIERTLVIVITITIERTLVTVITITDALNTIRHK